MQNPDEANVPAANLYTVQGAGCLPDLPPPAQTIVPPPHPNLATPRLRQLPQRLSLVNSANTEGQDQKKTRTEALELDAG